MHAVGGCQLAAFVERNAANTLQGAGYCKRGGYRQPKQDERMHLFCEKAWKSPESIFSCELKSISQRGSNRSEDDLKFVTTCHLRDRLEATRERW
jgi:hypothetical protein